MERTYAEYAARQAMELLAIDSPTGFTARAADWVQRAFEELGYTARRTAKGGVLVDLGGRGEGLLLEAHADTLGGMVAALTVGKPRYAAVETELRSVMADCDTLRQQLLAQVQADAEGFLPLAAVYALPKNDPTRSEKLAAASADACKTPLHIMELCCRALDAMAVLAEKGSRLAVSDAGCGAAILGGALRAASLNVLVNTKTMGAAGAPLNERCLALLHRGETAADAVFAQVKHDLL